MQRYIYLILSYLWRNSILKCYRYLKEEKKKQYWREHRRHLGRENPDKIFYVIRRDYSYSGLFSIYITTLARIDEALKKKYIPIVDMQNNFNIYLDEEKLGKENAWEYYFEQPMGYTLDAIKKSKNVIIGDGSVPEMFPYMDIDFLMGKKGNIEYWKKLAKKYIRVNAEIKETADSIYNSLFSKYDKVLGVRCRGTDYKKMKLTNHPIQPEIPEVLREVKRIVKEYRCTKIFLMTEDATYYDACKKEFGDMVITYKDDFVTYTEGAIGEAMYNQVESRYVMGRDYLIETLLLAKCNYLCAGCVSSTVSVLLMAEHYEYIYLFDLGVFE